MEELRATIRETMFRNEENGYTVVACRAGRENVTDGRAVSPLPPARPGPDPGGPNRQVVLANPALFGYNRDCV